MTVIHYLCPSLGTTTRHRCAMCTRAQEGRRASTRDVVLALPPPATNSGAVLFATPSVFVCASVAYCAAVVYSIEVRHVGRKERERKENASVVARSGRQCGERARNITCLKRVRRRRRRGGKCRRHAEGEKGGLAAWIASMRCVSYWERDSL